MKILISITYYYPNISGLTIYAKRLGEELAKKGHDVTVLTSRHKDSLAVEETVNEVKIKRSSVWFQIGKGVFMPYLLRDAIKLIRDVDVVICNLPQFESFILAITGKVMGKKVILTHHTDLSGWKGVFNRVAEASVWGGQILAGIFADHIVPYTKDYADRSWYLRLFKRKLKFIYPPISVSPVDDELKNRWLKKLGDPKKIIGFAGRIAKQKGIPYLLNAIPSISEKVDNFKIVFAGPYKDVVGERYFDEINQLVSKYKKRISFLGDIQENDMSTFYSLCDVLVLPSDDTLESFGIVQVEAMLMGCPVVATDLPGVRIPIQETDMGLVVPPGDIDKLAGAIAKVLQRKSKYVKPKSKIEKIFNIKDTLREYEKIFTY